MLVSAWMDMRSLLVGLGVPKIERHAYAYAGIRVGRQIPFDILFYIGLIGFFILGIYLSLSRAMEHVAANPDRFQESNLELLRIQSIEFGIIAACVLCFGLIALARRLWLSGETVRKY